MKKEFLDKELALRELNQAMVHAKITFCGEMAETLEKVIEQIEEGAWDAE